LLFFNDTGTTEIDPLTRHGALPILPEALRRRRANIVRGTVAPDPDRVRVEAADRRARAVATDTGSPGAEAPGEAPPGEPRATG